MDLSCSLHRSAGEFPIQRTEMVRRSCRSTSSWLSQEDLVAFVAPDCEVAQAGGEKEELQQGVGSPYSSVETGRLQGLRGRDHFTISPRSTAWSPPAFSQTRALLLWRSEGRLTLQPLDGRPATAASVLCLCVSINLEANKECPLLCASPETRTLAARTFCLHHSSSH